VSLFGMLPKLSTRSNVCFWIEHQGKSDFGFINEYLAASFLRTWHLNGPEFAVVRILPEHIPVKYHSTTIQLHFFQVPCFGSKYYDFAKEIDPSITVIRNDRKIIWKTGQ